MSDLLKAYISNFTDPAKRKAMVDKNVYNLKQAGAGAALPFMDNPSLPKQKKANGKTGFEGYSPVAVDFIPALVGTVQSVVDPNGKDNYFRQAADRVTAASDSLNSLLNIRNPETWDEIASNVVGGLALPIKGGSGIVKVAQQGSKAVRALKTAGTVAAETLIPFRQTGIKTAIATQVPLALGLNAVVNHTMKPKAEAAPPVGYEEHIPDPKSVPPVGYEEPTDVAPPPIGTEEYVGTEEDAAKLDLNNNKQWWEDHPIQAAGAGILGIGAIMAAPGVVRSIAAKKTAAALNHPSLGPRLTGVDAVKPTTDPLTETMGALVQGDQPMRVAARNAIKSDPNLAKEAKKAQIAGFEARRDLVNAIPLNGKITAALTTGELPNSAITARPIAGTMEEMAKDLDVNEQAAVSEGLLAQSALEEHKLNGVQTAFNDSTLKELQAKADLVANNPRLNKYATAIKQHDRDLLEYLAEQGMITQAAKADFITKRPNYTHMSRNRVDDSTVSNLFGLKTTYSPDIERIDSLMTRNAEEFGGVQVGATSDPIRELPSRAGNIIRSVELNKSKLEFFDILENNNALKDNLITKVPVGTKPKTAEGLITVTRNGVDEHYIVKDPSLFAALDGTPQLVDGIMKVANNVTKAFQFSTTGNANPFFALTAMANDMVAGRSLVPAGRTTGIINEGLGRMGLPDLGKLDPTHWLTAPVGAVRSLFDELPMALASGLSSKLVKEVPGLEDLIIASGKAVGFGDIDSMTAKLAAQYKKTLQYQLLKSGAANSGYTNIGPNGLGSQFADIAPEQYSRLSQMAFEEAVAGNVNPLKQAALGSKLAVDQVRANGFVRLYMNTLKAMQEGYRYQFAATNLPKVADAADLELLMAQTRASAADMAKTGNSQVLAQSKALLSYLTPSIQSNVAMARAFKADPINFITNKAVLYSSLLALQYGAVATNPELVQEIADMTDDMQTRVAKTFGGLSMPITQEDRIVWGQLTAIINDLSGISSGQLDPDWQKVFEDYVHGDAQLTQEGQMSQADSMKAALTAQIPSSPITNAIGALGGFDVGLSTITGTPQEIKAQTVDALGGDGKYAGDPVSATIRTLITSILGTSVGYQLDTALATARAMGEGLSEAEIADITKERFKDNTVRASGMAKNTLFGQYDSVQSVNDTGFRLWYEKAKGIDQAAKIYTEQVQRPDKTAQDKYGLPVSREALPERNIEGSVLEVIGKYSKDMSKKTNALERELGSLRSQINFLDSAIKDDPSTTDINEGKIEQRNARINEINVQRKELTEQLNLIAKDTEARIREETGIKDFTYQNFGDGKKYENIPMPIPVPQ